MADEINVNITSCVMRVSDLDRSADFYRDVFSCRVAVRADDMALLLTPKGFQIYLHVKEPFRQRGVGVMGVQHLAPHGHRRPATRLTYRVSATEASAVCSSGLSFEAADRE